MNLKILLKKAQFHLYAKEKTLKYCYKFWNYTCMIYNHFDFNNIKVHFEIQNRNTFWDYIDLTLLPEPYKKTASFYICLSEINQILGKIFEREQMRNPKFKWEVPVCGILTEQSLFMAWWSEWSMDYWIISESKNNPEEVEILGEETIRPFNTFLPYPEWKARISKKEFYVLMQIYYGVYGENIYYNALKSYEQEWKYAEIEKLYELYGMGKEEQLDWERLRKDVYEKRYSYNEELLNEYLMIKLLEKDTTWVFEWLEITKIYDERWSDADKLLNLPEIQELFWENVIIED